MKNLGINFAKLIFGGNQNPSSNEPYPIGIVGGGNSENWIAQVSLPCQVSDQLYVVPSVVVDNTGTVHAQGVGLSYIFR